MNKKFKLVLVIGAVFAVIGLADVATHVKSFVFSPGYSLFSNQRLLFHHSMMGHRSLSSRTIDDGGHCY